MDISMVCKLYHRLTTIDFLSSLGRAELTSDIGRSSYYNMT